MFKRPVHLRLILPFDSGMDWAISHEWDWLIWQTPLWGKHSSFRLLHVSNNDFDGDVDLCSLSLRKDGKLHISEDWNWVWIETLRYIFLWMMKLPPKSAPQLFTEWSKNNTSFGHTLGKPQNTTRDHTLTAYRAFSRNNYFMSSIRAKYWQNAISWWGWWRVGGNKGKQPFWVEKWLWGRNTGTGGSHRYLGQLESFEETSIRT